MPQFILTPVSPYYNYDDLVQVSQMLYGDELICINYNVKENHVFLANGFGNFTITSPDIPNLTIRDILDALNYYDVAVTVFWTVNNHNNPETIIDLPINKAPLNQINLYSPKKIIPDIDCFIF